MSKPHYRLHVDTLGRWWATRRDGMRTRNCRNPKQVAACIRTGFWYSLDI